MPKKNISIFLASLGIFVLLVLVIWYWTSLFSRQAVAPTPQTVSGTRKNMVPRFEEYSAGKIFSGMPAFVDFKNFPEAKEFQTILSEGVQRGPNFAGEYTVAEWSCGTECQAHMIVNARTGKVVSVPPAEPFITENSFVTTRGASFQLGSSLLVADPPCGSYPPALNSCLGAGATSPARYYLIEDDALKVVYVSTCRFIDDVQQCYGTDFEKAPLVITPHANDVWLKGNTYSLRWNGGPEKVTLFLVDRSLEKASASLSQRERISLENQGWYSYTVPSTIESSTYKWCIDWDSADNWVCSDYFVIE